MRREAVSTVVGVLLIALVAASCNSSGTDSDAEGPAAGSGSAAAGELTDVLAEAGIGVYDDPTAAQPAVEPAEPVSPLRLLRVQAEVLAPQLGGGAGMTATGLDEMLPAGRAGELTLVVSQVIDGWAQEAGTPAAELAAGLMARPSDVPEEVPEADLPRYSDLVLLLFASDLATAGASLDGAADPTPGSSDTGGPSGSPAAYRPASYVDVGAACQAAVGFAANVRAALTNAFNKLIIDKPPRVNTGFGLFDAIVNGIVQGATGLVNTVVRGAQIFVDGVYQATVGQVLKFVAEVAGVVGTLAQVTSYVKRWTVKVGERDPEVNEMGTAPAAKGPPGTVTVRVEVPFDKWDPGLAKCAEAVGRPLPNLKPEGQDVTWELDGYNTTAGMVLAVKDGTRTEAQLTAAGTGQFGYHAGVEPPPDDDAPEEYGVVYPKVTIKRDDLTKLQEMFHSLVVDALTGALPLNAVPFARTAVERAARDLLHRITDRAREALEKFRTETERGMIVVRYHGEGEDDPPAPEVPESSPSPEYDVDGCAFPPSSVGVRGVVQDHITSENLTFDLRQTTGTQRAWVCLFTNPTGAGDVVIGVGRLTRRVKLEPGREVTIDGLDRAVEVSDSGLFVVEGTFGDWWVNVTVALGSDRRNRDVAYRLIARMLATYSR